MSASAPRPADRSRLPGTAVGTNLGDFGATEWGLFFGVALMWGVSFALIDAGLEAFAPGVVTFSRVALGAITVTLIPRARRVRIEPGDRGRVVLLGLVWMCIPLLLYPTAQQWIDSSVAGMINGAMPLTTAMWATILLRRLPPRRQLVGLAVGFVGIVAISLPELPTTTTAGTAHTALGVALAFVAVTLYGLSANIAVPLQQRYGALATLLWAQVAAVVFLLPFFLLGLPSSSFAWEPAVSVLVLGVIVTGVAFVAMTTLVGRVGGPRGSACIYVVSVVSIIVGVLWRGEAVHPLALAGTALIVVGAWVASRGEPSRRRPTAPAGPAPGGTSPHNGASPANATSPRDTASTSSTDSGPERTGATP